MNSKLKYPLNIQFFAEEEIAGTDDKMKAAVDKATREAAEWKRKYNEMLTEDQKAKAEAEEQQKRYADINAKLVRAETVSSLIDGGYDKATAESIADAMASGDHLKVTDALSKYYKDTATKHQKELDAVKLQTTPEPTGGTGGSTEPTKESFAKMTLDDRVKLRRENPELYAKIKK